MSKDMNYSTTEQKHIIRSYEDRFESVCNWLRGRLVILRPNRQHIKEITYGRGLAHVMDEPDIQQKYQALYDEYYRIKKAGEIDALTRQGYSVTKDK